VGGDLRSNLVRVRVRFRVMVGVRVRVRVSGAYLRGDLAADA
jgi:hypothetical protein